MAPSEEILIKKCVSTILQLFNKHKLPCLFLYEDKNLFVVVSPNNIKNVLIDLLRTTPDLRQAFKDDADEMISVGNTDYWDQDVGGRHLIFQVTETSPFFSDQSFTDILKYETWISMNILILTWIGKSD